MIAVDTSTWVAFFSGQSGRDVDATDEALARGTISLPPIVVAELGSDVRAARKLRGLLREMPLLDVVDGYWERVGELRAKLAAHRLHPRVADVLIAQSCLDHAVPLVTRNADFRQFSRWARLKLVLP